MKILLLGYGKMGKTIEKIALSHGHKIEGKIDGPEPSLWEGINAGKVDVAIEFSQPDAAFQNIKNCLERNIPVISGTTGWLERKNEIEAYTREMDGAFFYASNFSIGVNLFFQLNKMLARVMRGHKEYDIELEEIHHTEKKDAPSGTAITLAEGILHHSDTKSKWVNEASDDPTALPITSVRKDAVPGTHVVRYTSGTDDIEIKHTAHTREGFAAGAVMAAEWIIGKKGVLGMADLLKVE